MKILCLGDIVGPAAAEAVCRTLWDIRSKNGISLVVANGENADIGNGITISTAEALLASGVDVITSGNHIWQKSSVRGYLDDCKYILRPINYPSTNPGKGYTIVDADGIRALIINVQGVIFMDSLASPFDSVSSALREADGKYDISILDIHAETTSEKAALAHYFDGRIDIVFGTHTHVQTADERILAGGSAFITDLGMCGVTDSALGVKYEPIIERMRTGMPQKFELADGIITLCGAIFDYNLSSNKVIDVKRAVFRV